MNLVNYTSKGTVKQIVILCHWILIHVFQTINRNKALGVLHEKKSISTDIESDNF